MLGQQVRLEDNSSANTRVYTVPLQGESSLFGMMLRTEAGDLFIEGDENLDAQDIACVLSDLTFLLRNLSLGEGSKSSSTL